MKLVENWRTWPRRWSVRLGVLASAVVSLLVASPDAALFAWNALPAELRAAIPSRLTPLIGVGLFVLSMLAQLIQQQKLRSKQGEGK